MIAMTLLSVVFRENPSALFGQTEGKPTKKDAVPETVIPQELMALNGHDREVACVIFHPDPKKSLLVSGGNEGAFITWEFSELRRGKKGAVVHQIERRANSDHTTAIDFDATGNLFAHSGVTHWGNGFGSNLAVFTPYRKASYGFGCDCAFSWTCVSISPGGQFLATGSLNQRLKVVSLVPVTDKAGKKTLNLASKEASIVPNEVWRTHWHPVQPIVAAGGKEGWIRFYEVRNEGLANSTTSIDGHPRSGIVGLKFTPEGEYLLSVAHDKRLKVWKTSTGKMEWTHPLNDALPTWCDIHPTYPWVAVSFHNGSVQIVDYKTGKTVGQVSCHSKAAKSVVFHPEGDWLATCGDDSKVKLWDLDIARVKRKPNTKPVKTN